MRVECELNTRVECARVDCEFNPSWMRVECELNACECNASAMRVEWRTTAGDYYPRLVWWFVVSCVLLYSYIGPAPIAPIQLCYRWMGADVAEACELALLC